MYTATTQHARTSLLTQRAALQSTGGVDRTRPAVLRPSMPGSDLEVYTKQQLLSARSKIENPNFFVDNTPAEGLLSSIGAVAAEVWIHRFGGVAFDNILIGTDEDAASALAKSTFEVRARTSIYFCELIRFVIPSQQSPLRSVLTLVGAIFADQE